MNEATQHHTATSPGEKEVKDSAGEATATSVSKEKQPGGETESKQEENHAENESVKTNEETGEKKLVSRAELHRKGLICEDRHACPQCSRRVFSLTMKFFQDKFFDLLVQQNGEAIACRGSPNAKDCDVCRFDAYHTITCICGKPTGANFKGIVAVELVQIHPTNKCLTDEVGPIKRCGCLAHVRMHLFCSTECKKASIFKDLPLGDVRREDGLIIGEKGPPMMVQQILNEEEPSSTKETYVTKYYNSMILILSIFQNCREDRAYPTQDPTGRLALCSMRSTFGKALHGMQKSSIL